jgi:hypothetical protein
MAPLISLSVLFFQLIVVSSVFAEQVRYCRFGHRNGEADFCVGLTSSLNRTTSQHDIHIDLSVRRSLALGWTAIGTGPSMAGSLMFIIYGDPSAGLDPIVSVRSADGHHQPRLLTAAASNTGISITSAKWQPLALADSNHRRHEDHDAPPPVPIGRPTHAALVSITCHACSNLLPGMSSVSTTTSSQPFIWAWNDRQAFDDDGGYTPDAKLHMHSHGKRSGGFGKFYVDMSRTLSNSSAGNSDARLPLDGEGVLLFGTSEAPIGVAGWFASLWENPVARAHGFVMGLAFVVLFPVGAALIRAGGKPGVPFRRHWVVQAVATGLAWTGVVLGLVMSGWRRPKTAHQWLGLALVVGGLAGQAALGWAHHVRFVRTRRRSWISYGHIWLGRGIVVGGWVNVVLGMLLAGRAIWGVVLLGGLLLVEAVVLGRFLWTAQRRAQKQQAGPGEGEGEGHALMPRDAGADDYFVLEMSDDEEDTSDGEDDALQKSTAGRYDRKQSVDIKAV